MPNHIHMIAVIGEHPVGAIHELPLRESTGFVDHKNRRLTRRAMLIPKMVGYFRMNVSKRINQIRCTPGATVWQRNYYEHIIRDSDSMNRIRRYIASNPGKWKSDLQNPNNESD